MDLLDRFDLLLDESLDVDFLLAMLWFVITEVLSSPCLCDDFVREVGDGKKISRTLMLVYVLDWIELVGK